MPELEGFVENSLMEELPSGSSVLNPSGRGRMQQATDTPGGSGVEFEKRYGD